jgi:hypothetical protein
MPLFVALAVVGSGSSVRAEPTGVVLQDVPDACRTFLRAPRDPDAAWNQALSLAGCLRDSSVVRIANSQDLEAALDELADRDQMTVTVYMWAFQYGPDRVRLRAAYEIGSTLTQLVVRARRSIAIPPDVTAERSAALHVELEPMMVEAIAAAHRAFEIVDTMAESHPELVTDPVLRYSVDDARQMLRLLPGEEQTSGARITTRLNSPVRSTTP